MKLSCKEVSELVSWSVDQRPALHQWLAMRLHLAMCRACAHYENQIRFLKRAARKLADYSGPETQLPAEARERIRESLKRPAH